MIARCAGPANPWFRRPYHNVLNRLLLLYRPTADSRDLVFGGGNACRIGVTTHCAAESLAWLCKIGGIPRNRAGKRRHRECVR